MFRPAGAVINVRKLFKANCGPGAVYLGSEVRQRGEHNVIAIQFEIVPEGRRFDLDGVLHPSGSDDEQMENAVLRIATIAKNIRQTLAEPDGRSALLKSCGRSQKPVTLPAMPWDDDKQEGGGNGRA